MPRSAQPNTAHAKFSVNAHNGGTDYRCRQTNKKIKQKSHVRTDHDLDYLAPDLLLYRVCVVQIQHRKNVLDHADYTAPTMQHELDCTDQGCILNDLDNELWRSMIRPRCSFTEPVTDFTGSGESCGRHRLSFSLAVGARRGSVW